MQNEGTLIQRVTTYRAVSPSGSIAANATTHLYDSTVDNKDRDKSLEFNLLDNSADNAEVIARVAGSVLESDEPSFSASNRRSSNINSVSGYTHDKALLGRKQTDKTSSSKKTGETSLNTKEGHASYTTSENTVHENSRDLNPNLRAETFVFEQA